MNCSTNAIENQHETYTHVDRAEYEKQLNSYYSNRGENSSKPQWTKDRVKKIIHLLEGFKTSKFLQVKRTAAQYFYARKYDFIEDNGENVLIIKRKSDSSAVIRIIPSEEYYDYISKCHLSTSHGGRDKIVYELKTIMQVMIPTPAVIIYLTLCKTCVEKKTGVRLGIGVVKSNASSDAKNLGHVDLIDFQKTPDGNYKWLLSYQDNATQFYFLRPLTSNHTSEVALELFKIFMEVGCPNCIQSKDRNFTEDIIQELTHIWPKVPTLLGNARNPNIQEVLDICNRDIEAKIQTWMQDNNSTSWSVGCYLIQFQINTTYQKKLKRSAYKALFGKHPDNIIFENLPNSLTPQDKKSDRLSVEVEVEIEELSTNNDDEKTIAKYDSSTLEDPDKYHKNIKTEADSSPIQEQDTDSVCCVCGKESSGTHKCWKCERDVHKICGRINNYDVGFGMQILCVQCLEGDRVKIKFESEDEDLYVKSDEEDKLLNNNNHLFAN